MAYQSAYSLRLRASNSAYLSHTFGGTGSTTKFSFFWEGKRSGLGAKQVIYSCNAVDEIFFDSSDRLNVSFNATVGGSLIATQVFRDPSEIAQFLVAIDTTQVTAALRVRIYYRGVEITAFGTASYPIQNYVMLGFNAALTDNIGRSTAASSYYDGYFNRTAGVDGTQCVPTNFGATDATTGAFVPISPTGFAYGTNGWLTTFSDVSDAGAGTAAKMGADTSGNGNNWTPNGLANAAGVTNDSLTDTPTNYGTDTGAGGEVRGNYPTVNPLVVHNYVTISEGNLKTTGASAAHQSTTFGTVELPTSGLFYWEVNVVTVNGAGTPAYQAIGMALSANAQIARDDLHPGDATLGGACYGADGKKEVGNSVSSYGATFTSGDVIGIAYDATNGALYFSKNGTFQNSGVPTSGGSQTGAAYTWTPGSLVFIPAVTDFNGSVSVWNFGQRPFAYTAPTGFKALCTQNLPDPAILKPSSYMDVNTRTGTGAAFNVTGKGFQPDLVWSKGRSGATDHAIFDSVRGVQLDLASNLTAAEVTDTQGLSAFNSDGFSGGTLAKLNTSAATYIDWLWKKGATPGLDIVTGTAPGSGTLTIAHSLGVVPAFVIIKRRDSTSPWYNWHRALSSSTASFLDLQGNSAAGSSAGMWGTGHTSSNLNFGVGIAVLAGGQYVAHAFAEAPGFSKFGSYTGNNSADGPFVYCGFKPRFVMIKDITAAGAWVILDTARDPYNVASTALETNASAAEPALLAQLDFVSNGFKWRATDANSYPNNKTTSTYIFAAFADVPFKYASSPYIPLLIDSPPPHQPIYQLGPVQAQ